VAEDPFGTLIGSFPRDESPSNGWVLMLVPANRPADAIGITGMQQSGVMSDVAIDAVVRSWEERFGAIVTAVGPGCRGACRRPAADERRRCTAARR
jgi:hypothetical protein